MALSALPTASLSAEAAFAYRGGAFREPRSFAQTAVLVRHPRGDLLLDTGLGAEARRQFEGTPFLMHALAELRLAQPAVAQLRAHRYDFARLRAIVPTHVHWDHVSGIPDFPGVPVWLNPSERAFVAAGHDASALMRSFGQVPIQPYAFDHGPYLGFPASHDVWGDGALVLVPAPGHTPGSIIAFVALPSGRRFAFVGDLVWQAEGLTLPAERPWVTRRMVDHDAAAVRRGISHVAALRARFPELTWVPAHDARSMSELPVFPGRQE
jgi:N-acyl homoserine lactone hydrolase